MSTNAINTTYELPEAFFAIIRPYIEGDSPHIVSSHKELIAIWRAAIEYRTQFPELQESIAEWTMSAGASSDFIADNGLFEEIHHMFGELEVPGRNNEKWGMVEKLINEAAK